MKCTHWSQQRGTHLALTMALLDTLIANPVQRLGISATMEPLEEVAKFLVPVKADDRDTEGGTQSPSSMMKSHPQSTSRRLVVLES